MNGVLSAIAAGILGCAVGYGIYVWHNAYLDYCREHGFGEDHEDVDAAGFEGRNYIELRKRS